MLNSYVEIRDSILEKLAKLMEVTEHTVSKHFYTELGKLRTKIKNSSFNLVVLGQFKRGKTTFINAILGQELLPTAVVPLTSIVTVVKYGDDLELEVCFNDGVRKRIPVDELPDYVTEKGNPCNEKNVERIEIAFPSPYLKDGVMLIDTPGVGSVYQHNTDVAYEFIPNVDAAIFLISVDPPISQGECDFLKDIREHAEKIFFLQNKVDYLVNEKDRQESLDFSRRVIEEQTGLRKIKIYPISAKLALEGKKENDQEKLERSMLPQFEQRLAEFLMREKGKTLLLSGLSSTLRLLGEARGTFELQQKAMQLPLEELRQKIAELNTQIDAVKQEKEDNACLFRGEIERLIKQLDDELKEFKETQTLVISKAVENYYNQNPDLTGKALAQKLGNFLRQKVLDTFEAWYPEEEKRIIAGFDRVVKRFAIKANNLIEYITKLAAGLFELKIEVFTTVESLTMESGLYYMVEDEEGLLTVDTTSFSAFLPKKYARQLVLREIKEKIPKLVDRNAGRVRYDFIQRIEKSSMKFRDDLNEKIEAALEGIQITLQNAMVEKTKSESEVLRALGEIQSKLNILAEVEESLIAAKSRVENFD